MAKKRVIKLSAMRSKPVIYFWILMGAVISLFFIWVVPVTRQVSSIGDERHHLMLECVDLATSIALLIPSHRSFADETLVSSDLSDLLIQEGGFSPRLMKFESARGLVDPWGGQLRLGIAGFGSANGMVVKVWSIGPNRLDELTGGDDISASYPR